MPISFHQDGDIATASQAGKKFLIFYASVDDSGHMWCPDCRDVEDHVKQNFEKSSEEGVVVYVGQKAEWKSPDNIYRSSHNVQSVPTILRLKEGKEDGRLVLGEIVQPGKLEQFIHG